MVTDKIADLLTRIRNAAMVNYPTVDMPASKYRKSVLSVLKEEGYIEDFREEKGELGHPAFRVTLKYGNDGKPVFKKLQRVSSPGKRVFARSGDIPVVKGGLGTIVVSTSSGMMSDREARSQGIGGELVCSVF